MMSDEVVNSVVESETSAVARDSKKKERKGKQRAKRAGDGAVATGVELESSGRVSALGIKLQGDLPHLHFRLSGKKASENTYVFETADPLKLSLLLQVLTVALNTENKVRVRSVTESSGINQVTELEIH
jgi:hypothetical protein